MCSFSRQIFTTVSTPSSDVPLIIARLDSQLGNLTSRHRRRIPKLADKKKGGFTRACRLVSRRCTTSYSANQSNRPKLTYVHTVGNWHVEVSRMALGRYTQRQWRGLHSVRRGLLAALRPWKWSPHTFPAPCLSGFFGAAEGGRMPQVGGVSCIRSYCTAGSSSNFLLFTLRSLVTYVT